MLKEIFHDSFENFEITRICMENHASVTGWQKLFFSYKCFQLSAAVAIAILYFSDVRLKMSELFSYLPKVDHMIKSC